MLLLGLAWSLACGDRTADHRDSDQDAGLDADQDAEPDAEAEVDLDAGQDAGDETGATDQGDDIGEAELDGLEHADAEFEPEIEPEPQCNNGVKEQGEECDGQDFGDATCEDYGLVSGKLTCTDGCTIDSSTCAECGDGACEPGESVASCPTECGVVDIAAGPVHTCAALRDGSVVCWGARAGHRLGGSGDVNRPLWVPAIIGATKVACGAAHSCALLDTGQVACWGRNGFGEVGTGENSREVFPPRTVPGLPPLARIAAGEHHSCASTVSGAVYCWGRGDFGSLGNGQLTMRRPTPVQVTGVSGTEKLTAGRQHTCALGNSLHCWGHNDHGQIGTGNQLWQSTPHDLTGAAFGVGAGYNHTCATFLRPARPIHFSGLFCWGSNGYGQLGAAPTPNWLGPQRIAATTSRNIAGGRAHTCVVDVYDPGVPVCWGGNDFGQLGDGTQESRYAPGPVGGITTSTVITAGQEHTCVILDDQTVRCWGRNHKGQLGDGSDAPLSTTPVEPVGL